MSKLANVIKKANFTSKFMSKVEDIATELGYDVTTDYQYGLQTKYTIIISKDYKTYLVVEVIETNEAYDYINIYRANGEQPLKQWQRYATNFDVKFFLPILDYITDELTPTAPAKQQPAEPATEEPEQERPTLYTAEQVYDYGEQTNWQDITTKEYVILMQDIELARLAIADMEDKGIEVPKTLFKARRKANMAKSFRQVISQAITEQKTAQQKIAAQVRKEEMSKKAEYYDAVATFINPDGNYFEHKRFMGDYTEDEIIKEVIKEFPKVKKEDITIEFGVNAAKKSNFTKKADGEDVKLKVQKNKPVGLDTASPQSLPAGAMQMVGDVYKKNTNIQKIEAELKALKADLDAVYQAKVEESGLAKEKADLQQLTQLTSKMLEGSKNITFEFQQNLLAYIEQTKTVEAKPTDKWKFEKVFAKLEDLMGKDSAQKFLDNTINGLQSQAVEKTIKELVFFEPTQKQKKTSDTHDEQGAIDKLISELKDIYINLRNYYISMTKANDIVEDQLLPATVSSKSANLNKKAWTDKDFDGLWDFAHNNRLVFKQILKDMTEEDRLSFSKWVEENKTVDEIRNFNEKYPIDYILASKKQEVAKQANHFWEVKKDEQTGKWYLESPKGRYEDAEGKAYKFNTKEDALEEADYLSAEHKYKKDLGKRAAENGGWVVNDDEAWEKWNLWKETVGAEKAGDDIARAMGDYQLADCLAYIFRVNDFQEGDSNYQKETEEE